VDAGQGAAGDMLLAALLDAGADLDAVRAGLARLAVESIGLSASAVRRHGQRATLVHVETAQAPAARTLPDIVRIVAGAGLPRAVADFAVATFTALARAEARVHGVAETEVHFHEVGALDAIADVVGCALALDHLGALTAPVRAVSPVAVGSGTARTSHGPLPVPVPAVLELLVAAGAPIRPHPAEMELCTPTGAALLTTLATEWGPPPALTPLSVGVGAGRADPDGHPNVLRVVIGQAQPTADWTEAGLCQVESTIDDLDPRIWPDLLERLREAGAADAWISPALMRRGRPGQVLTLLADPDQVDLLCRLVFEHTTTLGVRVFPVQRRSLHRDQVEVPFGPAVVRVKRGYLAGTLVTVQPEYADLLAAAEQTGAPVKDIARDVGQRAAATPSIIR
jgi:pyridinium-3,5-bisthiocarboxylic acid mononucleotide nickel chelatase